MKANPDVIIVWAEKKFPCHGPSEAVLSRLNIPYVYVTVGDLADLADYPDAYDFLGKFLGKEEKTTKESAYCQKALNEVAATIQKIPRNSDPASTMRKARMDFAPSVTTPCTCICCGSREMSILHADSRTQVAYALPVSGGVPGGSDSRDSGVLQPLSWRNPFSR
ncbi:MAG: hypothetical protein V2B19_04130 [Pseudomonadota bacterium]